MKVLQIGYLNPYRNYGGVEKYIYTLASGLHKSLGYEVDVMVAGSLNEKDVTEFGKLLTLKVPFFGSKLFFLAKYFYARKVRKTVSQISGEYDVLHFHGDNGFIGKDFAPKTVLTLHGIAQSRNSVLKRMSSFLPSRIEWNNAKMAQTVFSISSEAADFFSGVAKSEINVIRQSVDTDFYKPLPTAKKSAIKHELDLPENSIIGLIIGTDPVRKGLLTAIGAVENIKEPDVLLVGIGFPDISSDAARYRNMGKVDEHTKLKCLQIADFFIFPSMKEGFPISVLEAAAVGIPLIVSKNSGVSELKALVPYFDEVNSLEPEYYKAAIVRFMESLRRNDEIHHIKDRKLLELYSIPALTETYSKAYRDLLNSTLDQTSQK